MRLDRKSLAGCEREGGRRFFPHLGCWCIRTALTHRVGRRLPRDPLRRDLPNRANTRSVPRRALRTTDRNFLAGIDSFRGRSLILLRRLGALLGTLIGPVSFGVNCTRRSRSLSSMHPNVSQGPHTKKSLRHLKNMTACLYFPRLEARSIWCKSVYAGNGFLASGDRHMLCTERESRSRA